MATERERLSHDVHNSFLALNLEWSDASVRLLRLIQEEAGRNPASDALEKLLDSARVSGEAAVIVSEDDFTEVLHRHSMDAPVVLLGFNVPGISASSEFQRRFDAMLEGLPTTLLVCSSGEADILPQPMTNHHSHLWQSWARSCATCPHIQPCSDIDPVLSHVTKRIL